MGYAVYKDGHRWAGYGVPAPCDYPDCSADIDRGLGWKCESYWDEVEYPNEVLVEEDFEGCGMFFCTDHSDHLTYHESATPKEDTLEWKHHMLTDSTWAEWREDNPQWVEEENQNPLHGVLHYLDTLESLGPDEVLSERIQKIRDQIYEGRWPR